VDQEFHILCIDDDPDDVVLIEDVLMCATRASFKIAVAPTYQEALRHITGPVRYDAILLDHQLGAKSGIDLLMELRHLGWSVSPIIILTGLSPEIADREALAQGACDLLTKKEAISSPQLLERAILYAIDRHYQKESIQESEERYALAVKGSQSGIFDWQINEGRFFGSDLFKELLDLRPGQPLNFESWRRKIHPEDAGEFNAAITAHLAGETNLLKNDHRIQTVRGQKWIRVRAVAVEGPDGIPRRVSGSIHEITAEKLAEFKALHSATHDPLTGLANRVRLHSILKHQIDIITDNPAHSFSVVYVDLDRFKQINDGLGHFIGDDILMEASHRLNKAVGGRGEVTRHGGDEFVLVLTAPDKIASEISESIVKAFHHPVRLHNGGTHTITVSVGLLHANPSYEDPASLLRDADLAMYKAKKRGRDQLVLFDEDMRKSASRRFALEKDFREALRNGDVTVVYQPIVSLETGKTVALEALSRWTHPAFGPISPLEFVSIAEESGLVVELGKHTLRRVAQDIQSWTDRGDVSVSVNVSPIELMAPGFLTQFQKAIRHLPRGSIGIEITESAIVKNESHISETLKDLRREGVYAHLDDFGTGYASMSHLINLPLEGVKIDMSLTKEMHKPRAQAAIKAVLDLAHELGMYCVCEGVEEDRQRKLLKSFGMDFAQGYLLSKPMTANDVNLWLKEN
jgi:diguanylate cyclase (GGDEF)-like protein